MCDDDALDLMPSHSVPTDPIPEKKITMIIIMLEEIVTLQRPSTE